MVARISCTALATSPTLGRAIEQGAIEPVRGRGDRRQLPVAEMRGEDEGRLAVVAQAIETLDRRRRDLDAAGVAIVEVEVPQAVEMRIFGRDASEVLPHGGEDRFDLGGRLFRIGGGEVGAPGAMLGQEWPDPPHEGRQDVAGAVRVGAPDQAQQQDRETDRRRR